MTTLTLTMGVMAFFWASQTFGLQIGSAGVYFKNSSNSLLESLVIEDVWFNSTNKAWITVRNVGTIDVRIVAIYANSTLQSSTNPAYGSSGILVGVGRAVTIQVTTGFTWTSPQFVYISVATSRGTVVRGYWSTSN
jgi:hypothetical protein